MAKVRIVMDRRAAAELLRSPEIAADVEQRARRIASAAGPGHRVELDPTPNRARAAVITDTHAARKAEATNRTLTRAIDAGR